MNDAIDANNQPTPTPELPTRWVWVSDVTEVGDLFYSTFAGGRSVVCGFHPSLAACRKYRLLGTREAAAVARLMAVLDEAIRQLVGLGEVLEAYHAYTAAQKEADA